MTIQLPPKAQRKLDDFRDAAEEALTLASNTTRRISELQNALDTNPEGDNAANYEHEISRLRAKLGQYQQQHRERSGVVTLLQTWLQSQTPRTELKAAPMSKAQPEKGESLKAAIARVRGEIATVRAEYLTVYRAMPRVSDIKANIRRRVEELAKAGQPSMSITHEKFDFSFHSRGFTLRPDLPALLAWLDPDALISRLERDVEAMPTPELAMSANRKTKRLAELSARLDELERDEEALLEAALNEGQSVVRRPDASPAAILGVLVAKPAAVAA